jgi:hypothetical protein
LTKTHAGSVSQLALVFFGSKQYTAAVKSASSDKPAVLRRVRGWQAALVKERELARQQPLLSPAESLSQAMELQDLAGVVLFAPDPVRDREVKRVRALWRRLRVAHP